MSDEAITCYKCGISFAVPSHWLKIRREDKEAFWCPNGHAQHFTKSKTDKLAEELSRQKQRVAQLEDYNKALREEREAAERRVSAARGQITKMKKRVSAGVCPCCNRSFPQLRRHMEQKHPGFMADPIDGAVVLQLERKSS